MRRPSARSRGSSSQPYAGIVAITLALAATAIALLGLASVDVAHAGWFLPEQRLTWNTATQTAPDISGTRVAYSDYRNRRRVGGVWVYDTYVLDLKTMKTRRLTPGHWAHGAPAIDGYRVVWEEGGYSTTGAHGGISYVNLKTGGRRHIHTNRLAGLDISGSRIVYSQHDAKLNPDDFDVYVYNLSTRSRGRASMGADDEVQPAIDGARVVWLEDGGWLLYCRDLSTGILKHIYRNYAPKRGPAISGHTVVWAERADAWDIRLYNLARASETTVTTSGTVVGDPAISGDRVVWADTRHGNSEIYLYDIASKIEKRVTYGTSNKTQPTISGGRIVYVDDRAGADNLDLYMTRITQPVLTLMAPAVVPWGSAAELKGTLRNSAGSVLASRTVTLEISGELRQWGSVATTRTNESGVYHLQLPWSAWKAHVRTRFRGDGDDPAALSRVAHLKRALLFYGAPSCETTSQKLGVSCWWRGYFDPWNEYVEWPASIRLLAYRFERRAGGTTGWVYKRSFRTRAAIESGSYRAKYLTRIALPSKGKWRLRAYRPADRYWGRSYSEYQEVTVR